MADHLILNVGSVTTFAQNQVYSLPTRSVYVYISGTTNAVQQSNDDSNYAAVVLDSNGNAQLNAQFIKCTTTSVTISVKAT